MYVVDPLRNMEDEASLLTRFLKGENAAFALIYRKYANPLLSYGTGLGFDRETLKDAIHDVFCKLYANKSFLKNIKSLKSYLFKSLRNRLINIQKSQTERVDIDANEPRFSVKVTVLDELIRDEDRVQIQNGVEKYLNCLTSRQREAVYLRFIQDLDYEEIAVLLDMSPHGVRKLTSRAIIRIREHNKLLLFLLFHLQSLNF
ncbi:MAG: sigma-70 family RNA polymerase sigma factor [Prolixibacteraceae bacterium]